MAVGPIDARQCLLSPSALVAPFAHLGDEDCGVVVAALRVPIEFPGAVEQPGDAGHAVGAIERELERPGRVPAELVTERQMHDALAVARGVEALDFTKSGESPHRSTRYRSEFRFTSYLLPAPLPRD